MVYLFALLMACLGAFIGKLMAIALHYLPLILLGECKKTEEPRQIFTWFFQKPFCFECDYVQALCHGLPIIGFLLKRGKCPYCRRSEHRLVIFELGAFLFFGISALIFPIGLSLVFALGATCLLFCCFMTDLKHTLLPDQFTLSLIWLGLLGSLKGYLTTPYDAILGAALGYGLFWLINFIYVRLRGFDGMYPGDFKLNAGIGACVGAAQLFPIILISMLLLCLISLVKFAWSKEKENPLHREIPYACPTALVALIKIYAECFLR